MNDVRRNALLKIYASLDDISTELDDLKDDEKESFHNLPESIQRSTKGQKIASSADSIWSANDCIADALRYIKAALSGDAPDAPHADSR